MNSNEVSEGDVLSIQKQTLVDVTIVLTNSHGKILKRVFALLFIHTNNCKGSPLWDLKDHSHICINIKNIKRSGNKVAHVRMSNQKN